MESSRKSEMKTMIIVLQFMLGGGICVDTVKKSLCRRLWARDIIQNLRPIKNNTEKSTEIWLHLMFYTCDYKFLIFPYFSSAGNCGT